MAKTRNLGNLSNVLTQAGNFAQQITPAQFDNSTNLATTAFVKNKGLEYATWNQVLTSSTLTVANAGQLIVLPNANTTITLPAVTSMPLGTVISIHSTNSGNVVQRQGTDSIFQGTGAVASLALGPGDNVVLVSANSSWFVISGSISLAGAGVFGRSIATNGYQKLPGGIIVQWGDSGALSGNPGQLFGIVYPIAFPNSALSVSLTNFNSGSGSFIWSLNAVNATFFNAFQNGTSSVRFQWIAIGF